MPDHTQSPLISLALQGGGAHGAFTWGVLDTLLEDGRFRFDGISGTSAGAMNALCLAHGLMVGGQTGAREALERFWLAVADSSPFPVGGDSGMEVPQALKMMLKWTDYLTPEQLNPLDLNPLRDIVADQFDFERLRRDSPVRVFIAATHANSGQLRVFHTHELTPDVLLASACLPTIHRTIVIDGEPYWDGGYSANPAIFPLLWECSASDLLLVLLTPLRYAETPDSAQKIRDRLRELSFNATFLREMRTLAHMRQHIQPSRLPSRLPGWLLRLLPQAGIEHRLASVRFHAISADHVLGALPADSKLAVNRPFFEQLRDEGRAHASRWLARQGKRVGSESTLDLGKLFY